MNYLLAKTLVPPCFAGTQRPNSQLGSSEINLLKSFLSVDPVQSGRRGMGSNNFNIQMEPTCWFVTGKVT